MRTTRALACTAVSIAMVAACSGESSDERGLATLEATGDATEQALGEDGLSDRTGGDTELSAEDAALEFSQCMRDEGIAEWPDPVLDAGGNLNQGEALRDAGIDLRSEEVRAAGEACSEALGGVVFGGDRRGLADNTELQDGLVTYSACLRDEGIDVGDLVLGPPASGSAGEGPGQGGGQGQPGAGGRDRAGRIADRLDLDADDPAVATALEVCGPLLDEAFANLGAGGPNPGNQN